GLGGHPAGAVEFVAPLADQFLGLADLGPLAAVLVDRHRSLQAHAVLVVLVGRNLQVLLILDVAYQVYLRQQNSPGAVHAVGRRSDAVLGADRTRVGIHGKRHAFLFADLQRAL